MTTTIVDDEILTLLAVSPFHLYDPSVTATVNAIFDGYPEADETEKVISIPLPYLVYVTTPGYDNDPRQCGDVGGRVLEFQVTAVGRSQRQAKWALDHAREALSRKRLGRALIVRSEDNLYVRRDDEFTRPDGGPLFLGVDRYAVAI